MKNRKKTEGLIEKPPQPQTNPEESKKVEKSLQKDKEKEKMESYVQKIEYSLELMGFSKVVADNIGGRFQKVLHNNLEMCNGGALFTRDVVESLFRTSVLEDSFYENALFSQLIAELDLTKNVGGTEPNNFWVENKEACWELFGFNQNGEKIHKAPKKDCVFKHSIVNCVLELVFLVEGKELRWETLNTPSGKSMFSAALLFAF